MLAKWQARLSLRVTPAQSVQLAHQRIFIVPSASGIIYWLALVVMLLAAINYQNSLAYGLTFWLAALSLIAMLHTWRNLAGLNIQVGDYALVPVGAEGTLSLTFLASVRAHYGIEVCLERQNPRVDLAHNAVHYQSLLVHANTRGWQVGPRLKIQTLYPLGLFRAWSWVRVEQALLAYPAPKEGPVPLAQAAHSHASSRAVTAQGLDDFQGLRAYQKGDSLSRIHWKSLSKGLGLHSKTFAAERLDPRCLDLASASGDLESRLSLLSYWVLNFAQSQEPFSLKLGPTCVGPDTGQAHVQRCLTALALYGQAPCSH